MSAARSFWTARQSVLHTVGHLGLERGGSQPAEPYETVTDWGVFLRLHDLLEAIELDHVLEDALQSLLVSLAERRHFVQKSPEFAILKFTKVMRLSGIKLIHCNL